MTFEIIRRLIRQTDTAMLGFCGEQQFF